jgi:hypothetical protein
MKRFLFFTLLLFFCSGCVIQEKTDLVFVQNRDSSTSQENNEFRVILPKHNSFGEIDLRASQSQLPSLRLNALPKGDLELRVWFGGGLALLQGFLLKRTAGEWSATQIGWLVIDKPKNKVEVKPFDKNLGVPSSGWDLTWQKLVDAGISTLPDADEIDCNSIAIDGWTYTVEYNLDNTYRTYSYSNPTIASCKEAKQMIEIVKIIAGEYGASNFPTKHLD